MENLAHLGVVKRLFQLRNQIGGLSGGEKASPSKVPDYRAKLFKLRENLESLSPEVVQSLLSVNEYAYIKSFLQSEKAFQNHLDISDQLIGSDTQSIKKKADKETVGDRRSGTKDKDGIMNFFKNRTELVEELQDAVKDGNLDSTSTEDFPSDVTSNFFPWKLKNKYDNQQFAHYKHHTSKENPFKYQPITKLHTPVGNDNFFDFNHLASALHNLDKVKELDTFNAKAWNLSSQAKVQGSNESSGANTRSSLIQNVAPETPSGNNNNNTGTKVGTKESNSSSLVSEYTGNSRVINPVKQKEESVFAKFAPSLDSEDEKNNTRYVPMYDYVTGQVKNIPDKDDYPQDKAMEEVTIKGPELRKDDGNQNNLTSSISTKPIGGSGSNFKPLVPYSNKLEGYLKSHKVQQKIPSKAMPYIGEGQIYTPEPTPELQSKTTFFERVEEREDTTLEPDLSDQNILENLIRASPLTSRKRQEIHPPPALHVLQFVDDVIHHDFSSTNKNRQPAVYTAKRTETVNGRKDFLNTNKPGENPFGPNGLHRDIIQNVLKQYKKEAHEENEARRRAIMELHKLATYQDKMLAKHKKRRKRLPVVFNYNGQDEHINLRMHEWDDIDVWPHAHGHDFDHEFDHHDHNENLQVKKRKTNVARVTAAIGSEMVDVAASKKTAITETNKNRQLFEANVVDLGDDENIDDSDGSQRSEITTTTPDFDPEIEYDESGSGDWDESGNNINEDEHIVNFAKTGNEEELVDFPPFPSEPSDGDEGLNLAPISTEKTGNKKSNIEARGSVTRNEKFFENTQISFDGTDNYVALPSNLYFKKFDEDTVDELPNVGAHGIQESAKSKSLEMTKEAKLSAENLIPSSDSFESIAPEQSALTPENVTTGTEQLPKQRSEEEKRYFDAMSSLNSADDETKDGGQSSGSVKHDVESVNSEEKNTRASLISADNIGDLGNQDEIQDSVTTDKNGNSKPTTSNLKAVSADNKPKQTLNQDASDVTKYSNTESDDAEQKVNGQGN